MSCHGPGAAAFSWSVLVHNVAIEKIKAGLPCLPLLFKMEGKEKSLPY